MDREHLLRQVSEGAHAADLLQYWEQISAGLRDECWRLMSTQVVADTGRLALMAADARAMERMRSALKNTVTNGEIAAAELRKMGDA